MKEQTLNDYIHLLKPAQQEYIVHCVRDYGARPDFHRGLLPFLRAEEAAVCLKVKWYQIAASDTPVGTRFIRNLISVFEGALVHKLYDDEETITMTLSPMKLAKFYRKQYSDHFFITTAIITKPQFLVELQRKPGTHKWKVTGSKAAMDKVTTWLSDNFA